MMIVAATAAALVVVITPEIEAKSFLFAVLLTVHVYCVGFAVD